MTKAIQELQVKPGTTVKLSKFDTSSTHGAGKKSECADLLEKNLRRMYELQELLYADRRYALLIVLQALDAGGKDGTIRHVMSGVNPQGCDVVSFKVPSVEESEHDFLWRIHKAAPRRGDIGIFNRSHYEDVLVTRVHKLVPKEVWSKRYEQINAFERILVENNVHILKFFLHISRDEQKQRFEQRIHDPAKNWKISLADFNERKYWSEYTKAYEEALAKTSTEWAPWYVIPSDKKWYRNFAVSSLIVHALEAMDLKYPAPSIDLSKVELDGVKVASGKAAG
jgi:PPK2 family polyphosphate:nucleotide phosphotransferase